MAGVQVRLATLSTSEQYVTDTEWYRARIERCPWHPQGGCGFSRHGTYARVSPPGTLIARWYCPMERRTVSALPDCLASHRQGTLADVEATVRAIEQAPSLASAADTLRTDIELPGALRFLSLLSRRIHTALGILRGLEPETFLSVTPTIADFARALDTDEVLVTLRDRCSRYLPGMPAPLGFVPCRIRSAQRSDALQHRAGRDPPFASVDAPR